MLKNDRYDEAVEISQSLDQMNLAAAMKQAGVSNNPGAKTDAKGNEVKQSFNDAKQPQQQQQLLRTNTEQTKSQSVLNKPFDEALEFSHSGSEESMDTARDKINARNAAALNMKPTSNNALAAQNAPRANNPTPTTGNSNSLNTSLSNSNKSAQSFQPQIQQQPPQRKLVMDEVSRLSP